VCIFFIIHLDLFHFNKKKGLGVNLNYNFTLLFILSINRL